MRQPARTALNVLRLFLLLTYPLVHYLGAAGPAWSQSSPSTSQPHKTRNPQDGQRRAVAAPDIRYGTVGLPAPVLEMREAILSAVASGNIEDLRHAFELNELKPDLGPEFGRDGMTDPVAYWKQISGDGEGREILAILAAVLEAGYVTVPLGRDLENNSIYVWPYFAEVALDRLRASQEVELLRLVSPSAAKAMKAAGTYSSWRVAIGADGTWHAFRKVP
jgi:hypothetical protein